MRASPCLRAGDLGAVARGADVVRVSGASGRVNLAVAAHVEIESKV